MRRRDWTLAISLALVISVLPWARAAAQAYSLPGKGQEHHLPSLPDGSGQPQAELPSVLARGDIERQVETSLRPAASLKSFNCGDVTEIPCEECEALVALYECTDGEYWLNNTNWLQTSTPRDWHGVMVTTTISGDHVTGLYLEQNRLTGSIPVTLTALSELRHLDLSENGLLGVIPPELGNLANLTYLDLGWNELSGNIPAELGGLSALICLDLWGNQLCGSIPAELGDLANLTRLDLWGNQLCGSIPAELGNLTSLTHLDLRENELSGGIPAELSNLTSLIHLDLKGNELSGGVPADLGDLATLTYLDLSMNSLNGSIPPDLGHLAGLQLLSLSFNELTGTIPIELGDLISLTHLDLLWNELSGSIPPELGDLAALTYLDLSHNDLSGSIPPELSGLANLELLNLSANELTGPIPPELGDLVSIRELRLSWNHLGGSIPPELGGLGSISELVLGGNRLTGTLPAELGNLTSLQLLTLNHNALEGPVPSVITNLVNLNEGIYSDFGYNMLYSGDPQVTAFLDEKDPDWADNQTLTPPDFQVVSVFDNSVQLSWTPITYTADITYHYRIEYATAPSGPYELHGMVPGDGEAEYLADGLSSCRNYYFVIHTFYPAQGEQQNDLLSAHSQEVVAKTSGQPAYPDFGTPSWWNRFPRAPSQDQYPRMVADVNGDGMADAIGFRPGRGKGVKVGLSTGSEFGRLSRWTRQFCALPSQNEYPRVMGDVNGDGLADIVLFHPTKGIKVALSTGSSFGAASWWSNEFQWPSQDQYPRTLGDVNGDGMADAVGFDPSRGVYVALSTGSSFDPSSRWIRAFRRWSSQDEYPRMLGDVNGDGRADAVGFHPSKGVMVALSTGTSFDTASWWSSAFRWLSQDSAPRAVGDVNGDGLADVVGFKPGKGVMVALSSGSDFGAVKRCSRYFKPSSQEESPRMVADVSNDGLADIVHFHPTKGVRVGLATLE